MKIIEFVAASIGGGMLLGAGIRLGEKLARSTPGTKDAEAVAGARLRPAAAALPDARETGDLRRELEAWLEQRVDRRTSEAEAKLMAELERGRKEMLDAFTGTMQAQPTDRITRLEAQVGAHSAAISELRECAMTTEAGIHKLLGSIESLMAQGPARPSGTPSGKNEQTQEKDFRPANGIKVMCS